jgi:4-aminobutyrate aminotransferase-like enzyme
LEYPECRLHCAKYIEDVLLQHYPREDFAALIVEPVQGEAGYIVPPEGYLTELEKICRKNNLIII